MLPGNVPILTTCAACRRRKVRCDKKDPCSNCTRLRVECVYTERRRTRRPRARRYHELVGRVRDLEEVVQSLQTGETVPEDQVTDQHIIEVNTSSEKADSSLDMANRVWAITESSGTLEVHQEGTKYTTNGSLAIIHDEVMPTIFPHRCTMLSLLFVPGREAGDGARREGGGACRIRVQEKRNTHRLRVHLESGCPT